MITLKYTSIIRYVGAFPYSCFPSEVPFCINTIFQANLNPITSMDMTTEFFDANTNVSLFCLSLIVWFLRILYILIAFDGHRRSCGAKALCRLGLKSQQVLTSIFDCLLPFTCPLPLFLSTPSFIMFYNFIFDVTKRKPGISDRSDLSLSGSSMEPHQTTHRCQKHYALFDHIRLYHHYIADYTNRYA